MFYGQPEIQMKFAEKVTGKLGNVNRISDCRLCASGRNSGARTWQKVHMAFGKMSLLVWILILSYRRWRTLPWIGIRLAELLPRNFVSSLGAHSVRRGLVPAPAGEQGCRTMVLGPAGQFATNQNLWWRMRQSCSSLPLKALCKLQVLTILHYSSNAVWGNSKHSDCRSEMWVASWVQF